MNIFESVPLASLVRVNFGHLKGMIGEVVGHNYVDNYCDVYFDSTCEKQIHPLGLDPVLDGE